MRAIKAMLIFALLSLAGCGEYDEITRETGYKGRARINPWLAAERFAERTSDRKVVSLNAWKNPDPEDAVYFVPASLLSNETFTRRVAEWVSEGGHLVLLVENAEAEWNDWSDFGGARMRLEPALIQMLEHAGLKLDQSDVGAARSNDAETSEISFAGRKYKVSARAAGEVGFLNDKKQDVFASRRYQRGRMSVVMDARIFRSRFIEKEQHAPLLSALLAAEGGYGNAVFVRGAGGSFWSMLRQHLWPVLISLGLVIVVWLWRSFSRFGPLESAAVPSPLRGYDHHLEALGDFQWRLDNAVSLLAPLRERIIEGGQKLALKTGRRDDDFFGFLAERAGLTRERVQRALSHEAPGDSAIMTRTAGDIQRLLQAIA